MDSLKTIMDKQQYDLVIKLTENSKDSVSLFYRVSALLATSKGEEALDCIKKNRQHMMNNIGMLMRVHIEILCLLLRFDEAYEEIKYYEGLPYESQQVEEILRELPKMVREEERKHYSVRNLDSDQLMEKLDSNDSTDVLMALDIVRERDINVYLNKIQNVMLNFSKQSIRSFALLLLVQKKINRTFEFNHMGKIITINPSLLEPPFVDQNFITLVKRMDVEFKDPALSQNAVQILSAHVLYIYPDKVNLDVDLMIEALYQIANSYVKNDSIESLENRCKQKGLDLEDLQKLILDITKSQEDF